MKKNIRIPKSVSHHDTHIWTVKYTHKIGRPVVADCHQYTRLQVFVHRLGPFAPIPVDTATFRAVEDNLIPADLPPLPVARELAQTIPAQTYEWGQEDSELDEELWSVDEFVQKNAWKRMVHGAGPQRIMRKVERVRVRPHGETIPDVVSV
ncbi:hypothetical protein EDB85DRAFT_523156 [Lactarius pseudohatsudake]|nr:hypothetical protein EDB85DRAFT_523156 [Lactarius pseudohatsudake]